MAVDGNAYGVSTVARRQPASACRVRAIHAELADIFLSGTHGHRGKGATESQGTGRDDRAAQAFVEVLLDRIVVWLGARQTSADIPAGLPVVDGPVLGQDAVADRETPRHSAVTSIPRTLFHARRRLESIYRLNYPNL